MRASHPDLFKSAIGPAMLSYHRFQQLVINVSRYRMAKAKPAEAITLSPVQKPGVRSEGATSHLQQQIRDAESKFARIH